MRQVRVALLSPCYWPEVRRGTERFIRDLADGLIVRGHRPTLITSHPGRPTRTVEDGMTVLRLPRPPQGWLLRRGYEPYLTHVPLTYAALAAGHFDVAHAVYVTDALAAARWRRRTGRPAVLSYMGIPDQRALRWRRKRLELTLAALRGCDAVVALSRAAASEFEHSLGYDPAVIEPGVDLRVFHPQGQRARLPTILCSSDTTEPRKQVALLCEAFALVRREFPEARLLLSRPRDRRAARAAGVPDRMAGLEWVDLDDREVLAAAYASAWATVLPSFGEAFGLVLVESMACGTPVVGYADGAIPEVVDRPELGRLFDRLEPDALAGALREVLAMSREPEVARQCRRRAETFSTERCVESYLALYEELIARGSGRHR